METLIALRKQRLAAPKSLSECLLCTGPVCRCKLRLDAAPALFVMCHQFWWWYAVLLWTPVDTCGRYPSISHFKMSASTCLRVIFTCIASTMCRHPCMCWALAQARRVSSATVERGLQRPLRLHASACSR